MKAKYPSQSGQAILTKPQAARRACLPVQQWFRTLFAEEIKDAVAALNVQDAVIDLDKFPMAFSVVGEKQEKAADEETLVLLQHVRLPRHWPGDPARVHHPDSYCDL